MDTKHAFAQALKTARKARGLTQEDFSTVSSRTYLSTLERGLKSPTLEKIEAIASEMAIHPMTLLVLAYSYLERGQKVESLIQKIEREIKVIQQE